MIKYACDSLISGISSFKFSKKKGISNKSLPDRMSICRCMRHVWGSLGNNRPNGRGLTVTSRPFPPRTRPRAAAVRRSRPRPEHAKPKAILDLRCCLRCKNVCIFLLNYWCLAIATLKTSYMQWFWDRTPELLTFWEWKVISGTYCCQRDSTPL